MSYSLYALLKVREHHKNAAENKFKDALTDHQTAQKKLDEIKQSLIDASLSRTKIQNEFFAKSKSSPFNKREIICHASSCQKNILTENDLKKHFNTQEEQVRFAAMKLAIAKNGLLDAHVNLKLVENHYKTWQQQELSAEKKRAEHESDDLNGAQFILRKQ